MLDLRRACNTDRITSWCQGEGEDGTLGGGATTGGEREPLNGLACRTRACEIVVDKVALFQGFLRVRFSLVTIIPPLLLTHLSLSTDVVRINVLSLGTLRKAALFWKWG